VVATNNGCQSTEHEFKITVNPAPVIADKTPLPICSGSPFTVTPTNVAGGDIVPTGTTYSWTMVPSNAGLVGTLSGSDVTTIAEVLTNNTNTVQTATYTVTPKSGDCEGEDFEIVVTVNPVAVVTAAPNPEVICSGSNTSITLTPASTGTVDMTYSWSATVTTGSNATISGFSQQTTPSSLNQIIHTLVNTGTSPGVVTYIVTPHFGTCAGTPISIPVTVNPLGQVDQEDDQVICQGETTQAVVFSTINTVGTTTYAWQIDKNIGLTSLSGTGNFPAFTAVNTTQPTLEKTMQVLDRLHTEGIDENTLASAKNYVKGQFPPRYETTGELAALLTQMFWRQLIHG
jgi:hypothetical protein